MEQSGLEDFQRVVGDRIANLNVFALLNGVDLEDARSRRTLRDQNRTIRLFYSYSHKDERLRDELETHLKLMQRQGLLETWHDRRINPCDEFDREISENLERADIILLLVSADFIASGYCYEKEMTRALERHKKGDARVMSIILHDVNWSKAPFATSLVLPKDGKPVTRWKPKARAWNNVSQEIEKVVEEMRNK